MVEGVREEPPAVVEPRELELRPVYRLGLVNPELEPETERPDEEPAPTDGRPVLPIDPRLVLRPRVLPELPDVRERE